MATDYCELISHVGGDLASRMSTCLEEHEICIRVFNHRRHSIAVEFEEIGLLQLGTHPELGHIGHVKLLEKHGHFPRVRSGWGW